LIGSDIAKRYARAFFEIAAEERLYEKYYDELNKFSGIIKESEDLKDFLANPVFDQADKKAVVTTLLQKIQLSPLTTNFLNLLVDKGRIGILPDIEGCYRIYMDDTLKRVRVSVRSAFPLSAELKGMLQKKLEELTGKQVDMSIAEDASLLGGIVVRVGDTLYDGSIRAQLNNINNLLGEEI
jgi:F-type H+-transporting ATPase subunit delta